MKGWASRRWEARARRRRGWGRDRGGKAAAAVAAAEAAAVLESGLVAGAADGRPAELMTGVGDAPLAVT